MKKTILISFLALTTSISAQIKPKYGLSAGLNMSSFSGSDKPDGFSSKTGIHAGGFLWNYLSDKISIDAELYYAQMGAKFEISAPTIDNTTFALTGKVKNDYIRFPVLFDYHATEEFSIALGPEIGILLKNKLEYDKVINGSTTSNPKNVQQFDAGLKIKAQYIFSKHYLASVGYYFGMTKVYKNTEVYLQNSIIMQEAPKIYNSNLGISVGYIF
ncbi:Outer membrane protein beta-barrel domain-containing protein [Chryseobacterium soldanellicola]|uniref:Outer membrane protein beta-barrel domain-containing protein n=1 Tax=Chryseobacterium soldanellicola TaxID=311333 RepID=A0A1H1A3L3_9FLAO|nr:porin family protein [Chryseobacterium soldanellicola]SDQ34212.1 Outer membrane protein beta-barrel domain-containing protein [Chryseobacterium soldanellicola]